MTHRVYKNEYNEEFIYQLSHNFISGLYTTDESTENVLVVSGELEDLEKLASLMYKDEARCKEVFPSFQTEQEVAEATEAAEKALIENLQKSLLNLVGNYGHRSGNSLMRKESYKKLHDLYFGLTA